MKTVRSNLLIQVAQKSQRERRRITLTAVSRETGISYYTLNAIARDEIEEYPKAAIAKLCEYFDCAIGDLLWLEEVPEV